MIAWKVARRIASGAIPCVLGFLAAGCGPSYKDTLNRHYDEFGVKKLGTLVWCQRYVPGVLRVGSTDKVRPGMDLACSAHWDKFLSPRIRSAIDGSLRDKGYAVVDLRQYLKFRDDAELRDVLAELRGATDADAVLVVPYSVSPFRSRIVSSSFGSGRLSGGTRTRKVDVDTINLEGRFKLYDFPSLTMLWELGDRSGYYVAGPDEGSREQIADAVSTEFGTRFAERHGMVRGCPECPVDR